MAEFPTPKDNAEWVLAFQQEARDIRAAFDQTYIPPLEPSELAKYIDHTNLGTELLAEDLDKLCDEAIKYGFATVCVRWHYISYCEQRLRGSSVGISIVVGFPEGTQRLQEKRAESIAGEHGGCTDLDIVLNRDLVRNYRYSEVYDELHNLRELDKIRPDGGHTKLKLIIETSQLTIPEVIVACVIARYARFDYVKTSTGMIGRGASIEDIRLMKFMARDKMKVKASGGIRDYNTAIAMIETGASRIGTSSGIKIMKEAVAAKEAREATDKDAEKAPDDTQPVGDDFPRLRKMEGEPQLLMKGPPFVQETIELEESEPLFESPTHWSGEY
ncbi:aldolase [Tothia fuscella]|uniref:deoxyribose-phosphate aldolase n=1 Tax=Tothia fuscella TaxID=1048955 RepID=A0A9P4P3E8_9PEZI|nr:aldolase [Tothia fuscella]